MAKIDLDLNDLTNAALKRLVKQLLSASDGQEEEDVLSPLARSGRAKKPSKNELADLKEEGRGKAPRIEIEEDEDMEEDS
jgi:hypothetical protein